MKKKASESFCIEAAFPTAHQAELGAAEAWEAGASGVEERVQSDDSTLLLLYAPAETAEAVCSAVARVAVARVGKPQLVVAQCEGHGPCLPADCGSGNPRENYSACVLTKQGKEAGCRGRLNDGCRREQTRRGIVWSPSRLRGHRA